MRGKNGGTLAEPWKQGQSGNPTGSSAKVRKRKEEKDRYKAIVKDALGAEKPDRTLLMRLLRVCFSSTEEEVNRIVEHDLVPFMCKTLLKESTGNPEFALKLLQLMERAEDEDKGTKRATGTAITIHVTTDKEAEAVRALKVL